MASDLTQDMVVALASSWWKANADRYKPGLQAAGKATAAELSAYLQDKIDRPREAVILGAMFPGQPIPSSLVGTVDAALLPYAKGLKDQAKQELGGVIVKASLAGLAAGILVGWAVTRRKNKGA